MEYSIGQIINGTISGVKQYGVFINFGDKFGFCHISNCSHKYIKNLNELFPLNKEVTAKILEIDNDSGRMNVSIKECESKEESRPKIIKPITSKSPIQIEHKEEKMSFEDMMKNYLKSSDEKLDSIGRRNQKHRKR